MSSHSAQGQSFWGWLFHRPLQYQPTSGQRSWHQRAQPVYEPEPESLTSVRQVAQWSQQLRQLGMQPDHVAQQPVRHTDAITPIPRSVAGMPLLPLPAPNDEHRREVYSELATSKGLPGLPRWVLDLRNNPPVTAQPYSDLATVRADRGGQPVRVVVQDLDIDKNPTWQSPDKTEQKVAEALARVNSMRLPPVEPLTLVPLAPEAIASTDRTASGQVAEADAWLNTKAIEFWAEPDPARAELFADVRQASRPLEEGEPTEQSPVVRERLKIEQIIKQMRESE
jgi:hypothetical protein